MDQMIKRSNVADKCSESHSEVPQVLRWRSWHVPKKHEHRHTSSPVKVGFVGLWASITHGPSVLSLSDKYTLTAISTSSPESASQAADKFTKSTGHSIKAYHENSDDITNDPDVELVAVAVKAPDHKKTTLPAMPGKTSFLNGLQEWVSRKLLN